MWLELKLCIFKSIRANLSDRRRDVAGFVCLAFESSHVVRVIVTCRMIRADGTLSMANTPRDGDVDPKILFEEEQRSSVTEAISGRVAGSAKVRQTRVGPPALLNLTTFDNLLQQLLL